MNTSLEQLRDLLAGTAATQVVKRVCEAFSSPTGEVKAFFEQGKAIAERPFALNWADFAETNMEQEVGNNDSSFSNSDDEQLFEDVIGGGSISHSLFGGPIRIESPLPRILQAGVHAKHGAKTRLECLRDMIARRNRLNVSEHGCDAREASSTTNTPHVSRRAKEPIAPMPCRAACKSASNSRYTAIIQSIQRIVARRVPHLPAHERDEFAVNFVSDWVTDCYRMIKDQAVALRVQFREQGRIWTPSSKTACELLERVAKSLEQGELEDEYAGILLAFQLRYLQSKVGSNDVRNQARRHWRRFLRLQKLLSRSMELTAIEVSSAVVLNSAQKLRERHRYNQTFKIFKALMARYWCAFGDLPSCVGC